MTYEVVGIRAGYFPASFLSSSNLQIDFEHHDTCFTMILILAPLLSDFVSFYACARERFIS